MHLMPNHLDDLIIPALGGGLLVTILHFLRLKLASAKCWFCNLWSRCDGSERWEHWYNVARESYETQLRRANGYRNAFQRQGVIIQKLKEGCRTHKKLTEVIEMLNKRHGKQVELTSSWREEFYRVNRELHQLKSEHERLKSEQSSSTVVSR